MNEDQFKSHIGSVIPDTEDHPLHILNNQVDPEKRIGGLDTPQKPLRTYDLDIEEALSHLDKSKIPSEFRNRLNQTQNQTQEKIIETKIPEVEKAQPNIVQEPIVLQKPNPILLVKPLATQTAPPSPAISPLEMPTVEKKPDLSTVNLRTYEGDVAQALSQKQSSVVNIAIEESKRRDGEESISNKPPSQIGKNIFKLLISIILIVAGAGGGYYLYLQSPLAVVPVTPEKAPIPSIIKPDIQKVIDIGSLKEKPLIDLFLNEFNSQSLKLGKISEFVPVQTVSSTTKRVTGSQFVNSLGFDTTDTFKRALTDQWMIGTYAIGDLEFQKNVPFIILTTDFFQNAFAGMLMWENTIPEDFADLFNYRESVGTSTLFRVKGTFEDKVIANRDVRELVSENGSILLLYTFIDKNTLLITTSEAIIPAILDRIEKQTYLR